MVERLHLRELRVEDEASFGRAVEAFRKSDPDWNFAFDYIPEGSFETYVRTLQAAKRGEGMPDGWVPATFLVAVVDGEIVGRASLRHRLNPFLERIGGHVGYGVVFGHRRRGFATEMLRQTLPVARAVGLERILVTCDDENSGSARIIEKNGGALESVLKDHERAIRRYWIDLALTGS